MKGVIFIYTFKRINRGFDYYFEKTLSAGEEICIKLPDVSLTKTKIYDIGFQADDGILLYGTLSGNTDGASWKEIVSGDDINKTVNIIKAVSSAENQKLIIRVIMC